MIACVSPRWLTAFLDTPRATAPAALAFWQQVTQSTLSGCRGSAGEFATLLPGNGDPYLRTQEVGDDRAGCHLDVHVDDVRMGLARAVSCGAGVVEDVGTYVVMGSPGGFEFCLVTHRGEQVRPLPVRWPDGHQSLVDQLCVDVPGTCSMTRCASGLHSPGGRDDPEHCRSSSSWSDQPAFRCA